MAVKQIVSSYKRKFNRPHKVTEWDSSDNKPQRKTTWKVDETSLYTFRKNSYLRQKHGGSIVLILEKFDNQFVFVLVNECHEVVSASHLRPVIEGDDSDE